MNEKSTSRTGQSPRRTEHIRQEEIQNRSTRRKVLWGLGVGTVAAAIGGRMVLSGNAEGTVNSDVEHDGAEIEAEVDAELKAESVRDDSQEVMRGPVELLPLDVSAEDATQAYVAALNNLVAPGQSVDVTNQQFEAYSDAYLATDWQDKQANLLSSSDGADLVRQVADKVEFGQSDTGQLELREFYATEDDTFYLVVEVKGYTADQDDPQLGYGSVIPTKYARIELTTAKDEDRQRTYFEDAIISSLFNQADDNA